MSFSIENLFYIQEISSGHIRGPYKDLKTAQIMARNKGGALACAPEVEYQVVKVTPLTESEKK
jgi:hypothetical protein